MAEQTAVTVSDPRALSVIKHVATGKTLAELPEGELSADEFLLMVAQDAMLAKAYSRAREISGYALEDEALRLLRDQQREPGTQGKLRATESLANQLRWSAEKRNPTVYAKQAAVNLAIPIQINTSLDMGGGGGTGTADHPNIYALKAETVAMVPVDESESESERHAELEDPAARRRRLAAARRARWRAKKAATAALAEQRQHDQILAATPVEPGSHESILTEPETDA